jgi:hypothetical protein
VGDGNEWKDGTSENSIHKGWVVVKGLKRGKYELWNILWEWGLYTSENLQRKGWGFMCWECGLGMSGGSPVKLVWLLSPGHGLWSFRDCWTLCFQSFWPFAEERLAYHIHPQIRWCPHHPD